MPRLELDALCGVGSNHSRTYHPQKWTAPLGYRIVERLALILALLLVSTFCSIWAEDFPVRVVGFPLGLSPRTMQGLGYVQNFLSTWFPHRLESEDHARPWFCPKLFFGSTWFPHRLESEDHARPWFCPKLFFFFFGIGLSPRTIVQFLPFLGYFTRCRAGGCPW